jgi:hypothetical protein
VPTVHHSPCSCYGCSRSYLSHYKQTRKDITYTGIVPKESAKALPKLFFFKINEAKKKLAALRCSEQKQGAAIIRARWDAMSADARRCLLRVAVPDMPAMVETQLNHRQPKKPSPPFFKTCQRERFRFLVWGSCEDLVEGQEHINNLSLYVLQTNPSDTSVMQEHYFSEGYLDIWFAPQLVVMLGSGAGQVVPWNERRAHAEPSDVLGFPLALALLEGHLLVSEALLAICEAILYGPSHNPEVPLPINIPEPTTRSPAALESPPEYASQDLPPAYASSVSSPTCGSGSALPSTAGPSNAVGCVSDMPDEKPKRQQPRGGRRRKRGSKGRNKKKKRQTKRRQRPGKRHSSDELDDPGSEESDSDDETSDTDDESVCSEETIKPNHHGNFDSEPEEAEANSTSLHSRLNKGKSVARNDSSAFTNSEQATLRSTRELRQGDDPPFESDENSTSVPIRPSLASQEDHPATIAKLQVHDRQETTFPSVDELRIEQTPAALVAGFIPSRNKRSASLHHVASSPPRGRARRDSASFGGSFRAPPVKEKIKTRGAPNLSAELPFREESDEESDEEEVARSNRVIPVSKRTLEMLHMILPAAGETGAHEVH